MSSSDAASAATTASKVAEVSIVTVSDVMELMTADIPVTTTVPKSTRDEPLLFMNDKDLPVPFRYVTCSPVLSTDKAVPLVFVYSNRPAKHVSTKVFTKTHKTRGGHEVNITGSAAHLESMYEQVAKFTDVYNLVPNAYISILTHPTHSATPIIHMSWEFALAMCLMGSRPVICTGKVSDADTWKVEGEALKIQMAQSYGHVLCAFIYQTTRTAPGVHMSIFGFRSHYGPEGSTPQIAYFTGIFEALAAQVVLALYAQRSGRAVAAQETGKANTAVNEYTAEQTTASYGRQMMTKYSEYLKAQFKPGSPQAAKFTEGFDYVEGAINYWKPQEAEVALVYFNRHGGAPGSKRGIKYDAVRPTLQRSVVENMGRRGDGHKAANAIIGLLQAWAATFEPEAVVVPQQSKSVKPPKPVTVSHNAFAGFFTGGPRAVGAPKASTVATDVAAATSSSTASAAPSRATSVAKAD